MREARIFKNGQSQAVRLPKEFRFKSESVLIKKIGNSVILTPKENPWESLIDSCGHFSDDFMETREQDNQKEREPFL